MCIDCLHDPYLPRVRGSGCAESAILVRGRIAVSAGTKRQRGVSLIELIMFIVIVSISVAGILLVMNRVTGRSADPLIRKQALAVAESMLEEIQLQDMPSGVACAGTLGANAARTGASNVCDYNNYHTTAGILTFSTNGPVSGLESYNITNVSVTEIAALGGTAVTAGSGVQITVTVAGPAGTTVGASGYRLGK
jgi:MSHA pilin protein MshD